MRRDQVQTKHKSYNDENFTSLLASFLSGSVVGLPPSLVLLLSTPAVVELPVDAGILLLPLTLLDVATVQFL